MARVIYTGFSDIRELDAADLKKADVTGFRKTEFIRGQPTEVSDEVADALINHELFGDFAEAQDTGPVSDTLL